MCGRLPGAKMNASKVLLWTAMSLLALSSISSSIYAQESYTKQRLGESFKVKEQQEGLGLKEANYQWRISAVVHRKSRDGNDIAQKCAADVFALFGGHVAASTVEKSRAKELLDCVRVLAPDLKSFHPNCNCDWGYVSLTDEELKAEIRLGGGKEKEHSEFKKKIASPLAAVEELARKTVE